MFNKKQGSSFSVCGSQRARDGHDNDDEEDEDADFHGLDVVCLISMWP